MSSKRKRVEASRNDVAYTRPAQHASPSSCIFLLTSLLFPISITGRTHPFRLQALAPQNYNYQQHNSNYPRKENDLDLAASLNERQTDALKKLSTEVKTGSHPFPFFAHSRMHACSHAYLRCPAQYCGQAALGIMSRVPLGSARTCSLPAAGIRTHTNTCAHT